jgi:hypothetical protein
MVLLFFLSWIPLVYTLQTLEGEIPLPLLCCVMVTGILGGILVERDSVT